MQASSFCYWVAYWRTFISNKDDLNPSSFLNPKSPAFHFVCARRSIAMVYQPLDFMNFEFRLLTLLDDVEDKAGDVII
jgi:hypothetical protein